MTFRRAGTSAVVHDNMCGPPPPALLLLLGWQACGSSPLPPSRRLCPSRLYAVTGEQDGSGRPERCSLLDMCLVWERLSPMNIPRTRAAVTFFPPLGGIFVAGAPSPAPGATALGAYSPPLPPTLPAECPGGYRADVGFLPRLLQPSEARPSPPPLHAVPAHWGSFSPVQVYFVNGTPPMWQSLYGANATREPRWELFPYSRYARYAFQATALPVHGPQGLRDWRIYSVGGFNSSGGRTSCMEEFSCYHSQWAQMACVGHIPAHCVAPLPPHPPTVLSFPLPHRLPRRPAERGALPRPRLWCCWPLCPPQPPFVGRSRARRWEEDLLLPFPYSPSASSASACSRSA